MLTAHEAREKLQSVINDRETRIRVWVEGQLPIIEPSILDAISNAKETAYVTVSITPEYACDSCASYLSALIKALEDHKYTVAHTAGNKDCQLTIDWSGKKMYR